MKNIKEYLPFYIGQGVRIADEKFSKSGLELMGICDMGCQVIDHGIKLTFYVLPKDVKLVLRHLSDMTAEEAKQITVIIQEPFVSYDVFKERINITLNTTINGDKRDRSLWIFYTGHIELFSNNGEWGGIQNDVVKNVFVLFHYLLSRGFDLFGLINEGLAIDKTTLK